MPIWRTSTRQGGQILTLQEVPTHTVNGMPNEPSPPAACSPTLPRAPACMPGMLSPAAGCSAAARGSNRAEDDVAGRVAGLRGRKVRRSVVDPADAKRTEKERVRRTFTVRNLPATAVEQAGPAARSAAEAVRGVQKSRGRCSLIPWASDLRKKICHRNAATPDTLVGCFVVAAAPICRDGGSK